MSDIERIIDEAFERRAELTPQRADEDIRHAVNTVLDRLDRGKSRVAEKKPMVNGRSINR